MQVCHRVVIAREGELLFHELDPDLLRCEPAHDQTKVIEVAGQAIHGMHENDIAVSDEANHLLELGPVLILPRRLILKYPIDVDASKLTDGVLIESADSHISNTLTRHESLLPVLSD
jgi:hypothetical protein